MPFPFALDQLPYTICFGDVAHKEEQLTEFKHISVSSLFLAGFIVEPGSVEIKGYVLRGGSSSI